MDMEGTEASTFIFYSLGWIPFSGTVLYTYNVAFFSDGNIFIMEMVSLTNFI